MAAKAPAPAEEPQRPKRDAKAVAEAQRKRERTEWLIVALAPVAVMLLLGYLTYNEARGERLGFLAGIGWNPLAGVLLMVLIFALFSLGLNLQFGYTGLINFGHVAFLGIGGYTSAILAWRFGPDFYTATLLETLGYTALILLVSVAVATAFALLLGIPTLRLREDYLAILTIGAAEIMRLVWLNEEEWTNGPNGLISRAPGSAWLFDEQDGWAAPFRALRESSLAIDINPYAVFLILVALAILALVFLFLERLARSPWGRVVKAIREDEDVAAALGKNVFVYKLQSLVIGALIASIAGILYAWFQRRIDPEYFQPILTFYAWIILVLGGVGNNKGVIVGSFILWGLFESARYLPRMEAIGLTDPQGPAQVVFIGVLLIAIMMFRPQGVLGRKEDMLYGK